MLLARWQPWSTRPTTSSTSGPSRSARPTGSSSPAARALNLSVREFGLLVALARSNGRIVRREDLYREVWGGALRDGDRSIDVYVHKLRVKLEEALPEWRFIHTHVGLRLPLRAGAFTRFSHLGDRSVTGCPASLRRCRRVNQATRRRRGSTREIHQGARRVSAAVLALGVAACGSSSSNSSSSSSSGSSSSAPATVNGAGSTFAAPDLPAVAPATSRARASRSTTRASAPARGVAQLTAGTVDFAGSRPGAEGRGDHGAQEGRSRSSIPIVFGAITVSYNVSGVKSGLKLDGTTIADIFLGKIKKWNDPTIAGQNSGVKLPATNITVVHRSDASGTTKGFTHVPRQLLARLEERPRRRQDSQVADRHRRQGQRRRRRRGQADRRRDRLRRAGLRAAEQLHLRRREEQVRPVRRADARVDVGGR